MELNESKQLSVDTIADAIVAAKAKEGEIDLGPLFSYLSSKNGHELANEILTIVKTKLDQSTLVTKQFHTWEAIIKVVLVAIVLISATWLSIEDKFTPAASLLLGTIVGFLFGKSLKVKELASVL